MSQAPATLVVGQVLIVQIEDILSSGAVLVSLDGDLLRVRNETGRSLRRGELVELRVVALNPLHFQLLHGGARRLDRLA